MGGGGGGGGERTPGGENGERRGKTREDVHQKREDVHQKREAKKSKLKVKVVCTVPGFIRLLLYGLRYCTVVLWYMYSDKDLWFLTLCTVCMYV